MSPQAGWILQEEVVPRLRSAIPRNVNCVGAEDPQELVQDATVMAARMIDRVEQQGKLGKVTASNIAYYTIQHCKSGRRAGGSSRVDVMATATQLNGTTRLHSLNEVVAEDESGFEIFELQDVISHDHEDPAMIAARNLDWQALLARLTQRERAIVVYLLEGRTVSDVATAFKLDRSTLQQSKYRLAGLILEFMGVDVLSDLARAPGWRIDLDCEREAQACRNDRRHRSYPAATVPVEV